MSVTKIAPQSRPQQAPSAVKSEPEYFDLHTKGCGYLSRVRWVETPSRGRRSDPFLCCAINALHGEVNRPNYTYFDLRVCGTDAQQLVASLEPYVAEGKKVFLAFSIGDIYAHPYERKSIDNVTKKPSGKTEWTAIIKGRLLQVTLAKVNDVVIYSAAGKTDSDIDASFHDNNDGQEDDFSYSSRSSMHH